MVVVAVAVYMAALRLLVKTPKQEEKREKKPARAEMDMSALCETLHFVGLLTFCTQKMKQNIC